MGGAETVVIVLSHGHYDHTGDLAKLLKRDPDAEVFLHPARNPPVPDNRQGKRRQIVGRCRNQRIEKRIRDGNEPEDQRCDNVGEHHQKQFPDTGRLPLLVPLNPDIALFNAVDFLFEQCHPAGQLLPLRITRFLSLFCHPIPHIFSFMIQLP
ncbi:MAG: MBL fold metallo-hydrolase [Balneolaceae bacterium]|nr:MAG: MBL fold metallo-hydrolase [Balneolaceae bacterium]